MRWAWPTTSRHMTSTATARISRCPAATIATQTAPPPANAPVAERKTRPPAAAAALPTGASATGTFWSPRATCWSRATTPPGAWPPSPPAPPRPSFPHPPPNPTPRPPPLPPAPPAPGRCAPEDRRPRRPQRDKGRRPARSRGAASGQAPGARRIPPARLRLPPPANPAARAPDRARRLRRPRPARPAALAATRPGVVPRALARNLQLHAERRAAGRPARGRPRPGRLRRTAGRPALELGHALGHDRRRVARTLSRTARAPLCQRTGAAAPGTQRPRQRRLALPPALPARTARHRRAQPAGA